LKSSWRGYIGPIEANYILLLLGHIHPEGKEAGLERLCSHYRKGFRLQDPHSIRQTLSGLLYNADLKVRRWTFNAIALVGNRQENLDATLEAIGRNREDEDVMAAGVAAVIALTSQPERVALLNKVDVALEGAVMLAAAQRTNDYHNQLAARRVNIDVATPAELRLAAVLVGLGKAPQNLFDIGHDNSAVIGRLNVHPDDLVSQYSTWSILENPDLGIENLAAPIKDIESRPAQVRAYTYRLLTDDSEVAEYHREYLSLGANDNSAKARAGLASGLRNTYFEGLEEIVLDWLDGERDGVIHDLLRDHMVAQAHRVPAYRAKVMTEYGLLGAGSLARARMEAVAEGTVIYGDFKRLALKSESLSLFGENVDLLGGNTVNNFTGNNVNIGVFSGGDAHVQGDVNNNQTNNSGMAVDQLSSLLSLLEKLPKSDAINEGQKIVAEAVKAPTKGAVAKVLEWMTQIKNGADLALAATDGFQHILEKLEHVVDLLPL
jgi:hypothetical protein